MGLIERLVTDLTSAEDSRAEAAALILASCGSRCAEHLIILTKSTDPEIRWWAIRTLAEMDFPEVSLHLITALEDPQLAVRQCAALGLRLHPDPNAIPSLVKALQHGDNLLATLAADALVAAGEPAVPTLLQVMDQEDHATQLHAVRALAEIGDPRAIPALVTAMETGSAIMTYWAEVGLERMGIGMVFYKP